MCQNKKCLIKSTCYRFNARASLYQSYSNFNYSEELGCYDFWDIGDIL
jgi:hypothetical protein